MHCRRLGKESVKESFPRERDFGRTTDTKPMMEDRKAEQMQGASRMAVGAISASVLNGLKCGRTGY